MIESAIKDKASIIIHDQYGVDEADLLPDEIENLKAIIREQKQLQVDNLSRLVSDMRDKAVSGRKASGIEQIWLEDEEYYAGIDDANRSTQSTAWVKAAGVNGGLSRTVNTSPSSCTAFFNVLGVFADAASARMGDMLLPSGDWNFVIKPTPVPDSLLFAGKDAPQQLPFADTAQVQQMVEQQRVEQGQQADKLAEKAELHIRDWLAECNYHGEFRRMIDNAARIGTGVLCGPMPGRKVAVAFKDGKIVYESKTVPESRSVSPWDCFPDPNCGDNIHDGNYFIERDLLTARKLRDLKELSDSGYIPAQIDKVLEEGPGKKYQSDGIRVQDGVVQDSDQFEVWYFYGDIDIDQLSAMGETVEGGGKKVVPAIVTIVNDTAIKAVLSPLDTGEFPYDFFPWKQIHGSPFGHGIMRMGRVQQEMINASCRALMNNMGLAAGPQWAFRDGMVYPVDGQWSMGPHKGWRVTAAAADMPLQNLLNFFTVPTIQTELQAVIQLGYKMIEDATGIMYLLQGQQGSAPDTVGGMELLNRNAFSHLRRLARTCDERITEPHIRRYYAWLLQYGEDDEKGDMQIQAVGSSALVEREVQAIESQQLLQASLNPAFGLDPEKAMAELLKAKRMSPEKFQLDDAKKQQQAQQPQVIPQVEAAKINAENRKELEAMRSELEKFKAQLNAKVALHKADIDTDRDTKYNESLERRDATNAQTRREELIVKRELAMLEYANREKISLDGVKARLADTAMKLRTQKELARLSGKGPQVTNPPTEPPQHAADGRAYQE